MHEKEEPLSEFPDMNFGDVYDAITEAFPDRPAIIFGDIEYSWRTFGERTNRLARALASFGLEPDSKVAFMLRNSPAYVELWAACAKGRFVHANVNYRYVDHELFYLIDNADAEVVAYDADFRTQIAALRPRLPGVKAWVEVGDGPVADFAVDFDTLCREGDSSPLDIERSGDDLYLMYTGGTTGYPKGVMWPARNRIAAIKMNDGDTIEAHIKAIAAQDIQPNAIPAAPMMHSTGLTTMASVLFRGGCIILLPTKSFDAETCVREIERTRAQRVAIVGDAFSLPLVEYLRDHAGEHDLSSVRLINSAGAMWSEHFKQAIFEFFPSASISDNLGSSEGSGLGTSVRGKTDPGETGRFKASDNVKLLREDLTEIERGSDEAGLLALRGALPIGYYKDPEKTAATFPVIDGVRYSMAGDWCRIDADGNMTLLGRGNNCINTGGEKVYPEEVEDAIKQMLEVVDAAVLGVPDERFGQAVSALIRTRDNGPIEVDALREHLSGFVARYKHPRHVVFTAEDFRHENGKINYRKAKRLVEDGL